MDTLEADRKSSLIEACYSGGFVDDFRDEPYLAMSSASKYYPSVEGATKGLFSRIFWEQVWEGHDAVTAFEIAREANLNGGETWPWQDPQIADHTTYYDFFA